MFVIKTFKVMSNHRIRLVLILSVVFVFASSCSIMCKNPVLKGTKWTAVQEMFVADAGTMTINHSLEFTTDKDVVVGFSSFMPAHPTMYMNPDGSVDTVPATSSEDTRPATYVYKQGKLTVTSRDGSDTEYVYHPEDGTLVLEEPWGEKVVFSRIKEQK